MGRFFYELDKLNNSILMLVFCGTLLYLLNDLFAL